MNSSCFDQSKHYWELTKPRLVSLVLLSTMVGYYLASEGNPFSQLFWLTLIGTALAAGGSMAINQWMETDRDAKMKRTAGRPLPSKKIGLVPALIFGTLLSITGIAWLFRFVNPLSALMSGVTVASYLFCYTPLKPITTHSTLIGAVPGAIPPLIGWSAACGELDFAAWVLFAIIFLWQMPHFLAISWMYRHEFRAADFRFLAVVDTDGKKVAAQMVFYSAALLLMSLIPTFLGLTGKIYFTGALILGIIFFVNALKCLKDLDQNARLLFRTSLIYLSLILILMVVDKQS